MRSFSADPSDEPGAYQRPRYEQRNSGYGKSGRASGLKSVSSLSSHTSGGNTAVFHKGDMVEHKAFGSGMILNLMPMGGDALVEIAFDTVGTKKLMLKTASQHMKKK
jgi:DNA helicase-2/ATP-dependent DNA helicase PcrA